MDDRTPTPPASLPPVPATDPALLPDFFERSVAAHPDAVAVEVPPSRERRRQSVTYRELHRQVRRVAAHLGPRVRREGVVAILLPRDSHLLYVAELAVLDSGVAYTGIDPAFPDGRMQFIVEDSGAVALLTDAAGRRRAAAAGVDPWLILEVADLIAAAPPADPHPRAVPWLTPRSLAYVIYTSGTTGEPKGVMIEHQSIVNLVLADRETFALSIHDRVAQGSSPAYDSSVEETWLAFAAGATLVVMDDETARLGPDLFPWLRRERISVLCPPPTLLRSMGSEDPAAGLPDLRPCRATSPTDGPGGAGSRTATARRNAR